MIKKQNNKKTFSQLGIEGSFLQVRRDICEHPWKISNGETWKDLPMIENLARMSALICSTLVEQVQYSKEKNRIGKICNRI